MPNCYYYDEQRNHCNCYVNENLNELLAENARLREQVDAAHMSRLLTENENVKLRDGANAMRQLYEDELKHALADNAKLRELARHMRTCMEHYEMDGTISCDRCPLDNDTGNCDFERRMSELGVDE